MIISAFFIPENGHLYRASPCLSSADDWEKLAPTHGVVWLRRRMPTNARMQRSVLGPSLGRRTSKCRETWRSSESVPPIQLRRITLVGLGARCGADELACKPDPVASQDHDQLRRVLLACY
jgi:hypothetical protein